MIASSGGTLTDRPAPQVRIRGMELSDYQRAEIEQEIAQVEAMLAPVEKRRCELLARLETLRASLALDPNSLVSKPTKTLTGRRSKGPSA